MTTLIKLQFEKYVVHQYGSSLWEDVVTECPQSSLVREDSYLVSLIQKTVERIDKSIDEVLEGFGTYISRIMMSICSVYIKPEWKTLDVLENTDVLLSFVRKKYVAGESELPRLRVRRLSPERLEAIYISHIVFAHLGRGVIKGVASYYGEQHNLHVNVNIKRSGTTLIQIKLKNDSTIL